MWITYSLLASILIKWEFRKGQKQCRTLSFDLLLNSEEVLQYS